MALALYGEAACMLFDAHFGSDSGDLRYLALFAHTALERGTQAGFGLVADLHQVTIV